MAATTLDKPAKRARQRNRQTKTCLVFDEKARCEYLRGFHKRKIERKKLAREQNDKRILEERKELLKQVRDSSSNPLRLQSVLIPELQNLVDPEIFDLPDHTVTVADIGDVDFVGSSGLRLGQNTSKTGATEQHDDADNGEVKYGKPAKNKSLRQQLASCTSQLSSQKIKAKRMKKKNMLRNKGRAQKKGQKKGKK